jgi:hypothetical protein
VAVIESGYEGGPGVAAIRSSDLGNRASKDDAYADEIVQIAREVFGKGRKGIEIIGEEQLLEFMSEKPQFLPARLRRLLE